MTHTLAELVIHYDRPGPRYTGYPMPPAWRDDFPEEELVAGLQRANASREPLSFYAHLPFCKRRCAYCGCNVTISPYYDPVEPFLRSLERELDLYAVHLPDRRNLLQLHWGGGTPTYLKAPELERVFRLITDRFPVLPGAEVSLEADPTFLTEDQLPVLKGLGFNRVSFGVQDFDPAVQQAVHRVQPHAQVEALMRDARELGFESINVDLIYGLPRQTPESFERTVRQVALLRPDRIAMYGYAHLPTRFKPQRRIVPAELPSGADRVGMLAQALAGFVSHGYQYIGMDHFALPEDGLAQAKRQGRLHRNFQGYSTQPDCDLIGLGVSAISRIGATYSQNAKTLDEYYDLLKGDALPVVRGLALTRDDLVRRAVIMSIMCHGRLSYESVALAHLIDVRQYFAQELEALQDLAHDGLVTLHEDGLEVTPLGWYFVRSVAMVFDRHLRADRSRERFSKVI